MLQGERKEGLRGDLGVQVLLTEVYWRRVCSQDRQVQGHREQVGTVVTCTIVEDVVRSVAEKLASLPNFTWFSVESENMESIHNHNAYAMVEKNGIRH